MVRVWYVAPESWSAAAGDAVRCRGRFVALDRDSERNSCRTLEKWCLSYESRNYCLGVCLAGPGS